MTPREEKFAQSRCLGSFPDGSGAIISVRAFGNVLMALTDEHRLFMISSEGSVSEVTDAESPLA